MSFHGTNLWLRTLTPTAALDGYHDKKQDHVEERSVHGVSPLFLCRVVFQIWTLVVPPFILEAV
jgi:hypothetical protein